ncbi:ABC transporter permease [Pseudobutyrivibrio xylanivorans]|uniref:Transport permease protein n=1 Tax=Pseudobutyrivibrio xylanivorans DSM 14809 TaxID=1123012 RepID=A0A1M6JAS8_PSEXY|nr:ABC transporter permease [Pseudobutyrivibrio xylanivorans]SHJ43798.1 ABC-2 type transport system permease protein [Pseudobutyrivibrio xylanivorans DSM 14809]
MEYGLKQYIFVIRELTVREIKRKYSRSMLGVFWSVLQPFLYMCVMTLVFSGFTFNISSYPAYYIIGFTLWTMFITSTTTSMTAFVDNRNLFQKSKLPSEIFVLSRVYTAFVNLLFSCVTIFVVILFFRIKITWTILIFFVDILFELMFTTGISYIFATIYVFNRDIKFLWKNLSIILVHMIAVLIPIERYPEHIQVYTKYNPLYIYPNIARDAILNGTYNVDELLRMVIWAVVSLAVGILVFRIKENDIVMKL